MSEAIRHPDIKPYKAESAREEFIRLTLERYDRNLISTEPSPKNPLRGFPVRLPKGYIKGIWMKGNKGHMAINFDWNFSEWKSS